MKKALFATAITGVIPSVGLLLYRVIFGLFMLLGHGWSKVTSFSEIVEKFPDPLGIGSQLSLGSAIFCEVVCTTLVVLGLATRIAVLPLIFTMTVAAVVVHGADPFFMGGGAAKEPALMYLTAYALLLFTGPGRFSIDAIINNSKK